MADWLPDLDGKDMSRLIRLAVLMSEGNTILRAIADHDVVGYTTVTTPERINITVQLDRSTAHAW